VEASFLKDRAHKRSFDPAGIQRIEIYLYGGDDEGWVDDDIVVPVLIDGGCGNDHLRAGGSPAVLLGGEGDDHLEGGKGRNILIGGLREDHINGKAGDDILIGGTTVFNANRDALLSILAEWNSSRDFATRMANLRSLGTGPRLNNSYFLKDGLTVLDNGEEDHLNGGSGRDWIFCGRRDRVTWQCGDVVDILQIMKPALLLG